MEIGARFQSLTLHSLHGPELKVLLPGSPPHSSARVRRSPTGSPMDSDSVSRAFFYVCPGVHNEQCLLLKSLLPLKVPSKGVPFLQWSSIKIPIESMHRFHCQCSIHSVIFLEPPVTELSHETAEKRLVIAHGTRRGRKGVWSGLLRWLLMTPPLLPQWHAAFITDT
jgi:hypothetical protein